MFSWNIIDETDNEGNIIIMKKTVSVILISLLLILLGLSFNPTPLALAKDKDKSEEKNKDKGNDETDKGGDNDKPDKDKDKDEKPPKEKPPKDKPVPPDKSSPPHDTKPPKKKNDSLEKFLQPYADKGEKDREKDKDEDRDYSSKTVVSLNYYDYDDDDNDWFDLVSYLAFGDFGFRYSSYPYNDPYHQGIYIAHNPPLNSNYSELALQLRSYYQKVDSDLWSYGLYGKILFPNSVSLDIFSADYLEDVDDGTDRMEYLSVHYNIGGLGSNSNMVIELGLGAWFLTNINGDIQGSLSFQTRVDYFPAKPWGVHLSAGYSAPANETLWNLDASLGWHLNHLELFVGYHSLINSGGDNLDGPTIGLALWF